MLTSVISIILTYCAISSILHGLYGFLFSSNGSLLSVNYLSGNLILILIYSSVNLYKLNNSFFFSKLICKNRYSSSSLRIFTRSARRYSGRLFSSGYIPQISTPITSYSVTSVFNICSSIPIDIFPWSQFVTAYFSPSFRNLRYLRPDLHPPFFTGDCKTHVAHAHSLQSPAIYYKKRTLFAFVYRAATSSCGVTYKISFVFLPKYLILLLNNRHPLKCS